MENIFENCKAGRGGAISWKNYLPYFEDNLYYNNEASLYGNDIASYAVALQFRAKELLPQSFLDDRDLQQERGSSEISHFEGIQSSGSLGEVYLVFVDYYGEVVTASNDDPITIQLTTNGSQITPRFDAGKNLWSDSGVFNLTDATFIGEPGTQVSFLISSSYIDGTLEQASSEYVLASSISFRECISGEYYTSDG